MLRLRMLHPVHFATLTVTILTGRNLGTVLDHDMHDDRIRRFPWLHTHPLLDRSLARGARRMNELFLFRGVLYNQ